MAKILTETRLINVKETFEEVKEKMDLQQWLDLTENVSFYGELTGSHNGEKEIRLNRNYIIEVFE